MRLFCISLGLPFLLLTASAWEEKPIEKNAKIQISNDGADWLQNIFLCSNAKGYCFPDETQVLTERFQRFVRESNVFFMFAYHRSPEEQKEAKEAYQVKWASIYPLYEEETWPFGRGNGGEEKLQNVDIRPIGDQNYLVTIDFTPSSRTVNRVRLIESKGHFLIDYIATKTIAFQVNKDHSRDMEFTQQWTWAYENESIPENEFGHRGKITAYYHPKTQNWLMNHKTYGVSGEMFLWIIGKPDGTYLYATSSPHPGEGGGMDILAADEGEEHQNDMPKFFEQTGLLKYVKVKGVPSGFLIGKEYISIGQKGMESKSSYIRQMSELSFAPLYALEKTFLGEPRLPYPFPQGIPTDALLLKEKTVFPNNRQSACIQLVSVTDTLVTIAIP